jgi:predicted RNA-binding protein associated with RNAse of E/G family
METVEEKRPVILRKRFIPMETVNLSDDRLLYRDPSLLITRWRTIRPKKDFASGVSYYFLDRGYKVSRFYGHDGAFLYWYCDVVEADYEAGTDTYLTTDLLLDIRVYPDGRVEILDEDELEAARAEQLITETQYARAKKTLNRLTAEIQEGTFPPEICLDRRYW